MKLCFTVVVFGQAQWWVAGLVLTCGNANACQLYSAASLRDQVAGMMICCATQSHYSDFKPTQILIMPSGRLGSEKYQFKSHRFDSTRVNTWRVGIRTGEVHIAKSSSTGGVRSTHSATPSGVCSAWMLELLQLLGVWELVFLDILSNQNPTLISMVISQESQDSIRELSAVPR